jgi:putative transposase
MARKLLIRTSKSPYHVTGRSNNKDFFYLDLETLWQIFMIAMKKSETLFKCDFHGFVLMSNHYHLLISTPFNNIDKVMEHLQREVAKKANHKSARINHFFGGPYKWSLIYDESYYWNAVKYIFRNPIRAGICDEVTKYPYSSLNRASKDLDWKMVDFFHNKSKPIILDNAWLNEPFMNETEETIRLALRRKEFKIPRSYHGYKTNLDTLLSKK